MGAEARLPVASDDPEAGRKTLARAVEELRDARRETLYDENEDAMSAAIARALATSSSAKDAAVSTVVFDPVEIKRAIAFGQAADRLTGQGDLLAKLGGDTVALGADEERGPWGIPAEHAGLMNNLPGGPRAVASSGPEFLCVTVFAPTSSEAVLAAKALLFGGRDVLARIAERYRVAVTDRYGPAIVFYGDFSSRGVER